MHVSGEFMLNVRFYRKLGVMFCTDKVQKKGKKQKEKQFLQ